MSAFTTSTMSGKIKGSPEIVSAPWVIPIDSPVLPDGALALCDGKILEMGQRNDLISKYPKAPEKRYKTALMPALVNAHMHLELSHIRNVPAPLPEEKFTDWIKTLLAQRAENEAEKSQIIAAFSLVLDQQHDSGVVLVGDVGNEFFPELHRENKNNNKNDWPVIFRMLEHLGPNETALRSSLGTLEELDSNIPATAHAPYSTVPQLLVAIKKRCQRLQHVFSVHTAECIDEIEFLKHGRGCFRDFLETRNSWDDKSFEIDSSCKGTVHYFDKLDLLDEKTLMVHCVHISDQELQLARKRNSKICLCPGSNRFLKVGKPPVDMMIASGFLPALGTDSFASNNEIDIWREMKILAEDHPKLENGIILSMATLGGARALNYDFEFGSLSRGKIAKFIHVSSPALCKCSNAKELEKELVSGGRPTDISWVDTVH